MLMNVSILILLLNCLFYFCKPLTPSHVTSSGVSGEKCTINDKTPNGYGTMDNLFGTRLRFKRGLTGAEPQRGLRRKPKNQNLALEASVAPNVTTSNSQPNKLSRANTDKRVDATRRLTAQTEREPIVEVARKEPSRPAEPGKKAQVITSKSRGNTGSIDKSVAAPRPMARTDRVPTDVAQQREESSRPAKPMRESPTQLSKVISTPTVTDETPSKLAKSIGQPKIQVHRTSRRQVDPTGMSRTDNTVKTEKRVPSTPTKPEQRPGTSKLRESSRPPEERKKTRPLVPSGSLVHGGSKSLRRSETSVAPVNLNVQSGTTENGSKAIKPDHSTRSGQVIPKQVTKLPVTKLPVPPNRLQNGESKGPLQIQNELLAQLPPRHKFTQLRRSDPSENLRNKFKQHASAIDLPKTKQPWGGISPVESYKRVERYYKSKDGKVAVWIVRQKGDNKQFIRKDMEYNPENKHDNDCVHEVNAFQRLHNSYPPCRFIVRAYAWDMRPTSDNRVRIVMEKHSGLHLNNYIIESKGLPEPMARFITKQIILGVNYLHSHGIIWRDLKGDNILMVESEDGKIDGRIVFSDFGYAHLCENGKRCTNTDFAGSDPYMAPEIVENLAAYENWQTTGNPPEHLTEHSYAVDWWSLGVVLHFMIYFSVPFDGLFPYTNENIHLYKPRFPKNIKVSKALAGEDATRKSMLQLLLEADPVKRLNGCKNLLNHPWITQVSDVEERKVLKDLVELQPNLQLYKQFAERSAQQKSAFMIALEEKEQNEAVADLNHQIDDLLADFNRDSTRELNDDLASDIMDSLNEMSTASSVKKKKVQLPRIDPLA